jgi:hypothetical protein
MSAGLATEQKRLLPLRLRWQLVTFRDIAHPYRPAPLETAMKFRWSEWLTAAALALAFSAFAGAEAAEQAPVETAAH